MCKFICDILAKLKKTRIVGYGEVVAFVYHDNINPQDDPSFKPFERTFVVSPSFFTSRAQAEKVVETCRHVAEEICQDDDLGIFERVCVLGNTEALKIWSLKDLWSPRELKAMIEWIKYRKSLERDPMLRSIHIREIGFKNWTTHANP